MEGRQLRRDVLRGSVTAAVVALAGCGGDSGNGGDEDDDGNGGQSQSWSMFGGGPQAARYNPGASGPVEQPEVATTYRNESFDSSLPPAVADSRVYHGANTAEGNGLTAWDEGSGDPQWSTSPMPVTTPAVFDSGIAVANDRGGSRGIVTVDGEGDERWRADWSDYGDGAFEDTPAGPPMVQDGTVAFPAEGKVVAVDAGNGEVLWTDASVDPTGLAVFAGGVVVVGDDRALVGFDPEDGTQQWRVGLPADPGNILARDSTVVTVAQSFSRNSIAAVDAAEGEKQWQTDSIGEDGAIPTSLLGSGADGIYVNTSVSGTSGGMWALSFEDGSVRWRSDVVPESGVAATDEAVYGLVRREIPDDRRSGNGPVFVAIDPEDGSELWTRTAGTEMFQTSPPIVAEDGLYAVMPTNLEEVLDSAVSARTGVVKLA